MEQNTIVITGANRGIGRGIAYTLANTGANIILACRNTTHANETAKAIMEKSKNPNIEVRKLDLASFESIRDFVNGIQKEKIEISTLINNAGVLCDSYQKTVDGYETTIQVNYISQFLLTRLLIPSIRNNNGQVINSSSLMYKFGQVNDIFFSEPAERYNRFQAYANSKLASLLFSLELAKRIKDTGILVNVVDPGIVNTNIITMHNKVVDTLSNLLFRPFIQTEQNGAETYVYVAQESSIHRQTGEYFIHKKVRKLSTKYTDHRNRSTFWEQTEKIVGID